MDSTSNFCRGTVGFCVGDGVFIEVGGLVGTGVDPSTVGLAVVGLDVVGLGVVGDELGDLVGDTVGVKEGKLVGTVVGNVEIVGDALGHIRGVGRADIVGF